MYRSESSILGFTLCVLFAMSSLAECGDNPDAPQPASATLVITHLQVSGQTLELGWKVTNSSDHDVWILDKLSLFEPPFEVYLAEDNQTLVIRRRLDVPAFGVWFATPEGRYVRLRPGEERSDSFSFDIPVFESRIFPWREGSPATTAKVTRIALEIGFYNEDLPGLIRGILEEAEKLNPTISSDNQGIIARYFSGLSIYFDFGGLSGFEASYDNERGEAWVPYTYQALKDEQVLRTTVNGVSIQYGIEQAEGEPPEGQENTADVTISLTKLDVNDTELKLSWKIKNNADHEVWICDNVNKEAPAIFEQFLDQDTRTLVLRRRFGLPGRLLPHERRNPAGLYVRLLAGQEKVESISIALPVTPVRLFSGEHGNAEYAERLALEIGFYDENLPALILEIVELAEHLDINLDVGYNGFREDVYDRFFGGQWIAALFKSDFSFGANVRSADANGEMWMFHMGDTHMGEKVLWVDVDNVSIPYKSNYPR